MADLSYLVLETGPEGQIPDWFRLLPLGEVKLSDGREPFRVDRGALEALISEWQRRGLDMVIDYEHQSIQGGQAPAAGWIKELQARDDGLWARAEWTKQGQAYLAAREYRYFSPVLRIDSETRKPLALMHVGLTNTPAINNLRALVAKAQGDEASMTINEEAGAMKQKIMQLLGMTGEKAEEEILALADTRLRLAAGLPEIAEAAGLKPEATVSEIKGTVLALKQGQGELAELQAKVRALETESAKAKAEAAVMEALKARKISPAEREFALKYAGQDLEAFKAWVAAKPEVMPGEEKLKTPKDGDADGVDADVREICKQMGVTPEAFRAEQKRQAEQA